MPTPPNRLVLHQTLRYDYASAIRGLHHQLMVLPPCRLSGLPARYVSGHMIGEGGSHAWVEVLLPSPVDPSQRVAVAYDPTNARRAGSAYLTVAVGRDYADVAPTHGTFSGSARSRLSTSKSLEQESEELVPA